MPFRNTMPPILLMLGASTRSAAFSAAAAGFRPWCGDLFADADLADAFPVSAVEDYPAALEALAREAPAAPWMYTGGLENSPRLIERIAARRTLYGNAAATLAGARDPFAIHRVLSQAGLSTPAVRSAAVELPLDGSWLIKSRRSCGGSGVAAWRGAAPSSGSQEDFYFQQRIDGTAAAAIFVAAGRDARLLGTTEQILYPRRGQTDAFRYAGSLGPLPLDSLRQQMLAAIGRTLAAAFDLRGLFGVDYVDDGHQAWAIELNPRYTASTEILERALSFSAVGWHVTACRDEQIPDAALIPNTAWHGKQIVYAPCDVTISTAFTQLAMESRGNNLAPAVADIPRPGTHIKSGRPVLTAFACGPSRESTLQALNLAEAEWKDRLVSLAQ